MSTPLSALDFWQLSQMDCSRNLISLDRFYLYEIFRPSSFLLEGMREQRGGHYLQRDVALGFEPGRGVATQQRAKREGHAALREKRGPKFAKQLETQQQRHVLLALRAQSFDGSAYQSDLSKQGDV
jgi:hypothetical protein